MIKAELLIGMGLTVIQLEWARQSYRNIFTFPLLNHSTID
jgi:hypothetical protein